MHWSIIDYVGIVSEPLGLGTTFSQDNYPVVAYLLSSGVILDKISLDEAHTGDAKQTLSGPKHLKLNYHNMPLVFFFSKDGT